MDNTGNRLNLNINPRLSPALRLKRILRTRIKQANKQATFSSGITSFNFQKQYSTKKLILKALPLNLPERNDIIHRRQKIFEMSEGSPSARNICS